MREESTCVTIPERFAVIAAFESLATTASIPVPTSGASTFNKGTPCFCMLDPIKARLASSFSKKGMSDAATETTCFGETSIISISSGFACKTSPARRDVINSSANSPFSFNFALACAIVYFASSIADK